MPIPTKCLNASNNLSKFRNWPKTKNVKSSPSLTINTSARNKKSNWISWSPNPALPSTATPPSPSLLKPSPLLAAPPDVLKAGSGSPLTKPVCRNVTLAIQSKKTQPVNKNAKNSSLPPPQLWSWPPVSPSRAESMKLSVEPRPKTNTLPSELKSKATLSTRNSRIPLRVPKSTLCPNPELAKRSLKTNSKWKIPLSWPSAPQRKSNMTETWSSFPPACLRKI